MERRLYFTGQSFFEEKDEAQALYILYDGEVVLEVADRVVATTEVPCVDTRFVVNEDGQPVTSPSHPRRMSNASMTSSAFFDTESNGADESLPEASVFGEEAFFGLSTSYTYSVKVRKMSDVRILHKSTLDKVLERYPADKELIDSLAQRKDVFPTVDPTEFEFSSLIPHCEEFSAFLQNHIQERMLAVGQELEFDSLHRNVHKPLLQPVGNISCCRINAGKIKAIPPGDEPSRSSSECRSPRSKLLRSEDSNVKILGPGDKIEGSQLWAGFRFVAVEVSYVSILHRGVVSRALEDIPAIREQLIPVLVQQQHQQSQKQANVRTHRQERVAKILRERSIFANTSQEFLSEILQFGAIRVFMPGDRIIEQGADGTSMFILSVGTANVVKEQMEEVDGFIVRTLTNIGCLTYGGVFGELVMLGVQSKRSASIVAGSICCTWEVEHHKILSILDRHPIERANFLKLVEEHLDKLAAPRIIYHQLFSCFSQQFRTLIGVNCERKLYFPDETIVREGTPGDRMYIMNLGSAIVEVAGQHVMQIRGGSHFGFQMVSSASDKERYSTTVSAETMCQVLVVSRSTYQHALHKYPEMQENAKQLEAQERARAKKQLNGFLQLVQRRRGLRCIIEALKDGALTKDPAQVNNSNRPLLEAMFNSWRIQMMRTVFIRREEEALRIHNAKEIDQWVTKRKERMEQVKPRLELEKLVKRNQHSRGPLKLMKIPKHQLQHDQSQVSHFSSTANLDGPSPYNSPSVIWRRMPLTARQSRRLPPLDSSWSEFMTSQEEPLSARAFHVPGPRPADNVSPQVRPY
eukprot:TRINITY_DN32333_c2_g1_i1.p1 TRINITY_DN32333_c2_g1~~TRINITY_DN32333_c2_g1_i1.p1  ORF type:complete len:870 (-),score=114.95 TRINITY_DN32333_c2_g1_i1:144-2561(-)